MSGRSAGRDVVERHEATLSDEHRRRHGAHGTPEELADRIVAMGWRALGREPRRTLDPSCGAGSILLAAAERYLAAGVPAREVLEHRLLGIDVDPSAVTAARTALALWAESNGAPGAVARIHCGDALSEDVPTLFGEVDLVCGNPPFLGQLDARSALDAATRAELARRWPELPAYTDAAALHLLAAVESIAGDGVVAMLQPTSVLGARDATWVRRRCDGLGGLVALWAGDEPRFASATVQVCVVVLERRATPTADAPVEVQWADQAPLAVAGHPEADWAGVLARLQGVPASPAHTVPMVDLASLATATAGFRDEFYAVGECVRDDPTAPAGTVPVITVGMIDPGRCRFGEQAFRITGRRMTHPVLDLSELSDRHPRVGRWAVRRLRPKVLVATQTRILEAVPDRGGDRLPLTPVISVEPHGPAPACALDLVAAALSAPSASAVTARHAAGTGRSVGALRPRAAGLLELPVPAASDRRRSLAASWRALADRGPGATPKDWEAFGAAADAALGVPDDDTLAWWLERHPLTRRVERA